ncbi:MAG: glycosyltransferase family 4 protein [Planctomycetaceae bacterium]|nr:glycosyltransferase family 4 protein [Planctomycetaceae bacterium]
MSSTTVEFTAAATVPTQPPTATTGVLHVINGEYYAGAERVQDLLAERLPSLGFSVGFACVKLDLFGECRRSRGTPLFDVSMHGRLDVRPAFRVAELVRQHKYRVIHCHSVRALMIGAMAAAKTGVPMIFHAHSPTSRDSTRLLIDRFNGLIERRSLRRAARVIAVSQSIADHMAHEGFEPSRIRVVPNGVPAMPWTDRPQPTDPWTLGVVALFRPRKGFDVLLDAMAILRQQGKIVRLRAIGAFESPRYQAEILEQVRRLGLHDQVAWTGFVDDVSDQLQRLDALVLPSLFGEGLPMVVLEAMAAGVPVVATRVAGVPEVIRDGQDGVLVPSGDADQLAQTIARLIDGRLDWSTLRRNAYARQNEQFSDTTMAAGVAAVYRELLA